MAATSRQLERAEKCGWIFRFCGLFRGVIVVQFKGVAAEKTAKMPVASSDDAGSDAYLKVHI